MPRNKALTAEAARELRRELHLAVEAGGLTIPAIINRMRKALGMSQAEFGKAFSLTLRQVWELENGAANPTVATLERLGTPFGFAPSFVIKPKERQQKTTRKKKSNRKDGHEESHETGAAGWRSIERE